jgi:ankyrin repeat protein
VYERVPDQLLKGDEIVSLCAKFLHNFSHKQKHSPSTLTTHDHSFLDCAISCWANIIRSVSDDDKEAVEATLQTSLRLLATPSTRELLSKVLIAKSITPSYFYKAEPCSLSPLHICATMGLSSLVKLLLTPTAAGNNDSVTLHRTILGLGSESSMSRTNFFDITAKDPEGRTPIFCAARYGHVSIIYLLLNTDGSESGINTQDCDGATPLFWAAAYGLCDVVTQLLSSEGVEVNIRDHKMRTALIWSARKGQSRALRLLIEVGKAEVNAKDMDGRTALSFAAEYGRLSVVEHLLQVRDICTEEPDNDGLTPLMYAAKKGQSEVAELFLELGKVDVGTVCRMERTALSWAANHNRVDLVRILLQAGNQVDVNHKDVSGLTPLALATKQGFREVMDELIKKGEADVNCRDANMRTPLMEAVACRDYSIVQTLLSAEDIAVNAQDENGMTSLAWAVFLDCMDITALLLSQNNIDVDLGAAGGTTPLMLAMYKEPPTLAVVKLLVEVGTADINARDDDGQTALSIAEDNASMGNKDPLFKELVDILVETGRLDIDITMSQIDFPDSANQEVYHGC